MNSNSIAIIGAGITGLTAAYFLEKSGTDVQLFDRSKQPGGAIKSVRSGEWMYEAGPNTLLLKDPEVAAFIEVLGLEESLVEANREAKKRFIVKNGELIPLGGSPVNMIRTPLFSGRAKLRLLAEPFVSRSSKEDESVAGFVERRFGRELLDYAVNPFVAGIHAGKPETLSVKHAFPVLHDMEQEYGSVLVGAIRKMIGSRKNKDEKTPRRLISFSGGLSELPVRIAGKLKGDIKPDRVRSVEKRNDGWFLLTESGEEGPYEKVITTVPLHKWEEGFLPAAKEHLEKATNVYHPPLSVILLGFKKEQVSHPLDGFGFLVPEAEGRNILGALFSSTLFPGRAPDGHHLLTVFVGGSRQPELANLQGNEMLNLVCSDLQDLLGITGEPVFKEHIYWPNAIPQYDMNHGSLLDLFEEIESENPGLHLAGNYRGGISVPDCIRNGKRLAGEVFGEWERGRVGEWVR